MNVPSKQELSQLIIDVVENCGSTLTQLHLHTGLSIDKCHKMMSIYEGEKNRKPKVKMKTDEQDVYVIAIKGNTRSYVTGLSVNGKTISETTNIFEGKRFKGRESAQVFMSNYVDFGSKSCKKVSLVPLFD